MQPHYRPFANPFHTLLRAGEQFTENQDSQSALFWLSTSAQWHNYFMLVSDHASWYSYNHGMFITKYSYRSQNSSFVLYQCQTSKMIQFWDAAMTEVSPACPRALCTRTQPVSDGTLNSHTPVVWKSYTCSDHEQILCSCWYSLNNRATIYAAFILYWALEVI